MIIVEKTGSPYDIQKCTVDRLQNLNVMLKLGSYKLEGK